MGQYLKPNRDAKVKKKLKRSRRFDDEDDYEFDASRGKKRNKPNLKRLRDLEGQEY